MKTAKAPAKIVEAYRELLTEVDDRSKISVQNVISRAGVGRTTFYSYFDGVDDLTDLLISQVANDINKIIGEGHKKVPGTDGYVYIYTKLLEYIQGLDKVAQTVLLSSCNRVLTDHISALIRESLLEYYKERHEAQDPRVLDQTALFWTHGVCAMIREWMAEGCLTSPKEMAKLMCSAIGTCGDFFNKRTYN